MGITTPPSHACCLCFPHLSLSISRLLTAWRLLGLFPNPQHRRDASPQPPCRWPLGARAGAPQVIPGRAKGTHERCRSLPAHILTTRIDLSRSPLPYVANAYFKCFRCFRGMLQLFRMGVAKVDQGCCTCCICCKCFRGMLQAFVQNVSCVPDICCNHFDLDVAYVSHICFKYFICFSLML